MHDRHMVFGIHITERIRNAGEIQKVLTQYGCNIKTRIGLHHVDEKVCSPDGLILLEMWGDEGTCHEMAAKLEQLTGVEVQKMIFDHP
ncbi:MAG: hypothetical protein GXY55_02175 [Phycisphaerae bacterium]|nr:hypothetical protein [Phycisphaerae bacterium]